MPSSWRRTPYDTADTKLVITHDSFRGGGSCAAYPDMFKTCSKVVHDFPWRISGGGWAGPCTIRWSTPPPQLLSEWQTRLKTSFLRKWVVTICGQNGTELLCVYLYFLHTRPTQYSNNFSCKVVCCMVFFSVDHKLTEHHNGVGRVGQYLFFSEVYSYIRWPHTSSCSLISVFFRSVNPKENYIYNLAQKFLVASDSQNWIRIEIHTFQFLLRFVSCLRIPLIRSLGKRSKAAAKVTGSAYILLLRRALQILVKGDMFDGCQYCPDGVERYTLWYQNHHFVWRTYYN